MFVRTEIDFIAQLKYKKQGGRQTPVYSGYRPHIEFEDIPEMKTSGQQLFVEQEVVYPGDEVTAKITLLLHKYMEGRLYQHQKFSFYEGATKMGDGTIVEIVNKKLERLQ
jgi:elongation factor Tu